MNTLPLTILLWALAGLAVLAFVCLLVAIPFLLRANKKRNIDFKAKHEEFKARKKRVEDALERGHKGHPF